MLYYKISHIFVDYKHLKGKSYTATHHSLIDALCIRYLISISTVLVEHYFFSE